MRLFWWSFIHESKVAMTILQDGGKDGELRQEVLAISYGLFSTYNFLIVSIRKKALSTKSSFSLMTIRARVNSNIMCGFLHGMLYCREKLAATN